MKNLFLTALVTSLLLAAGSASAWNFSDRKIKALRFLANGEIRFSLFNATNSVEGEAFDCNGDRSWFMIAACTDADGRCEASNNRMASMLLTAQATDKPILIERNRCSVTEAAIKTN